ncbi:hypothetical protein BH11GEM2_BH11GEM2_22990 [soil metagenome]
MRTVALVAAVMLLGLAPRASLAQWRGVSNDEPGTDAHALAASARQQWEEALAARVTDAETWSAIGRRLYAAGAYRECIAAFEQSLVQRNGHSPADARFIADAYAKLGNVKQASRWRAAASGLTVQVPRRARTTV